MSLESPSEKTKGPITRRRFIIGSIVAAACGVGIKEAVQRRQLTDHDQLRQMKIEMRDRYRGRIGTLVHGGPEQMLTPAECVNLFRELPIEVGCMDEGLIVPEKHKFGIAGNAAGYRGSELEEFADSAMHDRSFMGRLQREWAHRQCKAHENSDEAAERAAREMARRFGLPQDRISIAGFSAQDDLLMQRDEHLHPAQGLLLDETMSVNEQALGLPVFKISTKHVPPSYVGRQIGIVQHIIEGEEGMLEVLGVSDPLFVVIAGNTRQEVDRLIRQHAAALDQFSRRPRDIPLIRNH